MEWQRPEIKHGILTKWNWVVLYPENLILGNHVDIGAYTLIQAQAGVEIQEDVQIGGGVKIYSVSTIDNKRGKVTIESGAKVGANSVIMPGVKIGRGATVGAMSFVSRDIPAGETWLGIPARKHWYMDHKSSLKRMLAGVQ